MIKSQQSNAKTTFVKLKISFLSKVKSCIIVFGLQPDFNLFVSVQDYWTFGDDFINSNLFYLDLSTCLN